MTDESIEKLRALLKAYAERQVSAPPKPKAVPEEADRQRRACGDRLRNVVRPVLEGFIAELASAGHEASLEDHTEKEDAYPSVALSFTPRPRATARAPAALASLLTFRYDPRRGILVQRDVRVSPTRGRVVTGSSDRLGTIGVDAVSTEWVETKTLNFIEAVLKAN